MSETTGMIFSIQRFCVNDGPGIRTTVFLKGCPLHCVWCHNPESQAAHPELFFAADRCVRCEGCVAVCTEHCHSIPNGVHRLDREHCTGCGKCASECPTEALKLSGSLMSVQAALDAVLRDLPFYEKSGGGMTLSGGEPMAQFDFTKALLHAAKEKGISTCIETCGFAPEAQYRELLPVVDCFLYDWKVTDPDAHRRYTGADNRLIRQNLHMLAAAGAQIVLRCPIIPGYNDDMGHFTGIAALANALPQIATIEIEPYHPLGSSKREQLGKWNQMGNLAFPPEEQIKGWIDAIQRQTKTPVRRA